MDLTTYLPAELCCEVFKQMMPQGNNRLLSLGLERVVDGSRYIRGKGYYDQCLMFRLCLSEEQRADMSAYIALRNTQHSLYRLLVPKKPFALSLDASEFDIRVLTQFRFSNLPWHLISEIQMHLSRSQCCRESSFSLYGISKSGEPLRSYSMTNFIFRLKIFSDGVELVLEDVGYAMLEGAPTEQAERIVGIIYWSNARQKRTLYNAA